MRAERALREARAPDEHGAQERAWITVRSAYRVPAPRGQPRLGGRVALVLAIALAVAGLVLSPAGATVQRLVRHALGVSHHPAAPLFSLPAPGRVLLSGPQGTWTAGAGGGARRVGPWTQASWSPWGRYLAVAGAGELAAVDPRGTPRWTIARPAVADATWFPPTGYRIAYLSGVTLRVVAGDGTGDHLVVPAVAKIAPAWRPGHPYQLAYVSQRGMLRVRDGDTGRLLWSARPLATPIKLLWSGNGNRLLALARDRVSVYGPRGRLLGSVALSPDGPVLDGALSPDGRTLAIARGGSEQDVELLGLNAAWRSGRRVLSGPGLGQLAWAPDGRWLLVSWPAADEWVFVSTTGSPRIAAMSRIAQQFSSPSARPAFPALDGWCCSAGGANG